MVLPVMDGGGGGSPMPEWCQDHPELCSAQPPSQPQQPGKQEECGPEYRRKEYSSVSDAIAVTINMRNVVYGAKPARVRLCVSPKRFTLTNVQVYVYADGKRVYLDNLGTVTSTVCRDISIPPPRITSTYVQRRIEFKIYATVGQGYRTQVASKECGGVRYGIYEVPVWKGPNPIVITHRETVTWYATPSEARMQAGTPQPGTQKIAFQLSANPLVIRKPFQVRNGVSYSNAKIIVTVNPKPVENIYFLDVEIPGATYRSDTGCYFYGPLRVYKYGCRRLGNYTCEIVLAPQRPGTYRVPIKACIYTQVAAQVPGGKLTAKAVPVKCTTFTAEVTFYQVAPQKPQQPPTARTQTAQPTQQPTYTTTSTQPTQQPTPPAQPTTPQQPTQPVQYVPPQYPQTPTYPTQPSTPTPQPPQPPGQPPEELYPTPPPSAPEVPVSGGAAPQGAAQPTGISYTDLLVGGAVLFLAAGAAIFAVSSLAKAESRKHAERLEEIKRRLEQHQPPSA